MKYYTIRARTRPTLGEVRPEAGTPTRCARYQAHRAPIRAAVQGRAKRVGTTRRQAARPLTAARSRATSRRTSPREGSDPVTRCPFTTAGPESSISVASLANRRPSP